MLTTAISYNINTVYVVIRSTIGYHSNSWASFSDFNRCFDEIYATVLQLQLFYTYSYHVAYFTGHRRGDTRYGEHMSSFCTVCQMLLMCWRPHCNNGLLESGLGHKTAF